MGLGDQPLRLTLMKLEGFTTHKVATRGIITLNVTLDTGLTSWIEEVEFYVVDVQSAYNAIIGTPTQASFDVVISVPHQRIKFPTKKGIGMDISNPKSMLDYLVKNKKVSTEEEGTSAHVAILDESPSTSRPQEYEEIILHPSYPDPKVKINRGLSGEELEQLKYFLIQHKDNFVWCTSNMPQINSEVAEQKLNIDPIFIPVQQKSQSFEDEKKVAVKEEVGKLLQAKFIQDVAYPTWLENVVMV